LLAERAARIAFFREASSKRRAFETMPETEAFNVVQANSSSTSSKGASPLANLSDFVNSPNKQDVTTSTQRLKELGQAVKNLKATRDVMLMLYQFKMEELAIKRSLAENNIERASVQAKKCYKIVTRCSLLHTSLPLYSKLENLMEDLRLYLASYSKSAVGTGRSRDITSLVTTFPSLGPSDEGISFISELLVDCVNFEILSQNAFLNNEPLKEIPFIFSYALRFLDLYFPDLNIYFEQGALHLLVQSVNSRVSSIVKPRLVTFANRHGTGALSEDEIENTVLIGRACKAFCEELQARTGANLNGDDARSSVRIDSSMHDNIRVLCSVYISNEIRLLRLQYSEIVRHSLSQGLIDAACVHDIFYILQRSTQRSHATSWSKAVQAIVRDVNEVLKDLHGRISQLSSILSQNSESASLSELGACIIRGDKGIENFISRSGVSCRIKAAIVSELIVDFSRGMNHSLESIVDEQRAKNPNWCSLQVELEELRRTAVAFERLSIELTNILVHDSVGLVKQILNQLSLTQYILSERQFDLLADSKVWAQPLIWLYEQLAKAFGHESSMQNCTTWLPKFLELLAARLCITLEMTLFGNLTFNQLGILLFERELRVLVTGLSNITQTSVRTTFSRLLSACRILSVDSITDVVDFWDASSCRLLEFNLDESLQVLRRRVDFTEMMVIETLDSLAQGERK
jgi:hypothetical protein